MSKLGDRYDSSAKDYISWDPKVPVLLRMEKTEPGSYPPMLVQTFLRQAVDKFANDIVIKYKVDNAVQDWTYLVSNCYGV